MTYERRALMSMSSHLEFFRSENDQNLHKMLDAAYALQAVGIEEKHWPKTLLNYLSPVLKEFGGIPDRVSAVMAMLKIPVDDKLFQTNPKYAQEGFTVNIKDLPLGTATIKFRNSW